jgi:hypothetical protein
MGGGGWGAAYRKMLNIAHRLHIMRSEMCGGEGGRFEPFHSFLRLLTLKGQ